MHPYLVSLLRWFLVALAVFAITVPGGIYLVDRILPKIYLAQTTLQINLPGNPPGHPTEFQPEFETIQSPLVLNAVIARLDLKRAWSKRIFGIEPGSLSDTRALAHLTSLLKIDYKPGGNLINISVSSDDPQEAADIANAVATEYKARREAVEPTSPETKRGTSIVEVTTSDANSSHTTTEPLDQFIRDKQKLVAQDLAAINQAHSTPMPANSPQAAAYAALQRDYEYQQRSLKRLQEGGLIGPCPTVVILSRALPGTVPIRPNRDLCLAVIIVAGFALSFIVPTLVELGLWFARASRIKLDPAA